MNEERSKNVYLIDDEEDFCHAFRDAVISRDPDLQVHYSTSSLLAEEDPHFADSSIVFVDLRMPDQTGEEFLREQELKGSLEQKRFIVVSGIVRCETSIPVGDTKHNVTVLPKPLDLNKALSLIEEHFADSSVG